MSPTTKPEGLRQSQRHERRLARKYDGQRSAASGAFWSRKGDVRTVDWLFEHKYTSAKSFRITLEVLRKIHDEAVMDGRRPALGIHMAGMNVVVLTEDDFDELAGQK